jgi:hypothetical protein
MQKEENIFDNQIEIVLNKPKVLNWHPTELKLFILEEILPKNLRETEIQEKKKLKDEYFEEAIKIEKRRLLNKEERKIHQDLAKKYFETEEMLTQGQTHLTMCDFELKGEYLETNRKQIFTIEFEKSIGSFSMIAIHPKMPQVLIIGNKGCLIYNYDVQSITTSLFNQDLTGKGGFFPEEPQVWLEAWKSNGWVDWGIWDYQENKFEIVNIECIGDYSRGASLHPSGQLVGTIWSAHCCGYSIHQSKPIEKVLWYYEEPATVRYEYECREPCFSNDGKYFAFITDEFCSTNRENKLLLFDISIAQSIDEWVISGALDQTNLHFINNSQYLAFRIENTIYLYHSKLILPIMTINSINPILNFQGHPIYEILALLEADKVKIMFSPDSLKKLNRPPEFDTIMKFARDFVELNGRNLRLISSTKFVDHSILTDEEKERWKKIREEAKKKPWRCPYCGNMNQSVKNLCDSCKKKRTVRYNTNSYL